MSGIRPVRCSQERLRGCGTMLVEHLMLESAMRPCVQIRSCGHVP